MNYISLKNIAKSAALAAVLATHVNADTPSGSVLSNYINSGYVIYTDTEVGNPHELALTTDLSQLMDALEGDSSHADGNIELYTNSDGASDADFANADHVELALTFPNGNQTTLSSLNGQDWFNDGASYNTSYGADNLANQWFGDLVDELNTFPSMAAIIAGNEQDLFEAYRDNGGFQQLSDPNISYVEHNGGEVIVGLGGFIDVRDRFVQLAVDAGYPEALAQAVVPNGIQMSEVVLIDGVATYGFEATDSGVRFDDGVDSYNGNYEVSVPEPSSTLLGGLGLFALLLRRNKQ